MKKEKHNDPLPDEMTEIRSGRVFEVPPDYFTHLNDQFFDQNGQYHPPRRKYDNIKYLRLWWIAASVVIVVSLTWWIATDFSNTAGDRIDESELHAYIQLEIMDYDLETLTQTLSDEDLYSVSQNESETYQSYIQEHLEDFDDIIYNQ